MHLLEVPSLKIRRSKTFSLEVADLHVRSGEILCVTGPNGSGKTTLIEALVGLLPPDTGQILMAGMVVGNDLRATKSILGFVPDDEAWFIKGLTAREYCKLLTNVYRQAGVTTDMEARVQELATALRFTAFDSLLEHLSHGNKKKVQLIAALMHQPKVIVVDELRNGLDPIAIITAERLIKAEAKRGVAIVATTHDLWWAQRIASDILLLVDGKAAVHQKTKSLVKKHGSLEKLFMQLVGM